MVLTNKIYKNLIAVLISESDQLDVNLKLYEDETTNHDFRREVKGRYSAMCAKQMSLDEVFKRKLPWY